MNLNNFTIKSQETLQQAITLARSNGNQALEPVHILKALMSEGESVVKFILQKLDIAPSMIERPLENELARLPKVNGGDPYLSNDASKVLEKASEIAQKNGDQYVTVEAIFMALHEVPSPASTILKDAGVTKKELQAAGLMTKGSLFKKSKANLSGISKEGFKKIDIRHYGGTTIKGKKVQIITPAPANSYSLTENEGTWTLTITNPTAFWSVSNFLVIRAD